MFSQLCSYAHKHSIIYNSKGRKPFFCACCWVNRYEVWYIYTDTYSAFSNSSDYATKQTDLGDIRLSGISQMLRMYVRGFQLYSVPSSWVHKGRHWWCNGLGRKNGEPLLNDYVGRIWDENVLEKNGQAAAQCEDTCSIKSG